MTYVEGFIVPVPHDKQDEYRSHAAEAWEIFKDLGVRRQVEAWADDVPDGTVTDFGKSVQAQEGEAVVFAWFEYPDRAARDAANARMMSDPRMKDMAAAMPFDGRRMVMGGFDAIVEQGSGTGSYIDGFVVAVPAANKEAYRRHAEDMAPLFREMGAIRQVEAWGDDVQDGKVTDFRKAVQAQEGEEVAFCFLEWPSREVRDAGWKKAMADPRMQPTEETRNLFDGKRMFWGGFRPILDKAA